MAEGKHILYNGGGYGLDASYGLESGYGSTFLGFDCPFLAIKN